MYKINKTYIVILAAAFVFAYMEGGGLAYTIFYSMLFIFIIGLFDSLLHLKDLYIAIKCDQNSYSTGESATFNLVAENNCVVPVSFLLLKNEALKKFNPKYEDQCISLRISEIKWIRMDEMFLVRGIYNFGNTVYTFKDMFSILQITRVVNQDTNIKIYPKIHTIKELQSVGNENFDALINKKGNIEDLSTIDDIRKYRFGDSLKRIHWKVSAKHGELYTRNFDTYTGEECKLILDMNFVSYQMDQGEICEEKLVEFFCSVLQYMCRKGIKAKAYINNEKNTSFDVLSANDMEIIKEYFLYNKSVGMGIFADFIETCIGDLDKYSTVCIFAPRITEKLTGNLLKLKYSGYNIMMFYIINDKENMKQVLRLKNSGIESLNFNELVS
jgi:hypothetical protein